MSEVRQGFLACGARKLVSISPGHEDDDPFEWTRTHTTEIDELLHRHGALLFRGFRLAEAGDFDRFSRTLAREFPSFEEESSPRHHVAGAVFTSTDYPADYPIQFHNEFSYGARWPMKIMFCCRTPALEGGETPIADTRAIVGRLGSQTRAKFARHGVLYRRRYHPRMGVRWQKAFLTEDREKVAETCSKLGLRFEWKSDDVLVTTQTGDAILRHPATKEEVWFNHGFFFNVRALEPIELRKVMLKTPEERLSTNTYYGDGSSIEEHVIEEIRAAYREHAIVFEWRRGDVLLIDNMLMSHCRSPFKGPREILAVMAESMSRADTTPVRE